MSYYGVLASYLKNHRRTFLLESEKYIMHFNFIYFNKCYLQKSSATNKHRPRISIAYEIKSLTSTAIK